MLSSYNRGSFFSKFIFKLDEKKMKREEVRDYKNKLN